jgi:surface-anchored protein
MKMTPTLLFGGALAGVSSAATITDGHVDIIGVGYVEESPGVFVLEPHSHVEFGTVDGVAVTDVEYEASELTFLVPGSTLTPREAGSQWDPIGVAAGVGHFVLPQSATQADALGSIFAGIGTEELLPADWSTAITITLTGMTGPGEFALAQVLLGTPTFFMSTADGISPADSYSQGADDHQHFNWYFTEPGDYTLSFDFTGTHAVDGPVDASATYNFSVVPEPSTALLGALGALALLRRRR